MIELIFLFFVLPRRMSRLARERNRNPVLWSLGAIGLWIGIEFFVITAAAFALYFSAAAFGVPKESEIDGLLTLSYVPALVGALVGTHLLYRRLGRRPATAQPGPSPHAAPYYGPPPS